MEKQETSSNIYHSGMEKLGIESSTDIILAMEQNLNSSSISNHPVQPHGTTSSETL